MTDVLLFKHAGKPAEPAVALAFNHVRQHHPGVTHVVYDRNMRWMYFDDVHVVPKFGSEIDVSVLEDGADAAEPLTLYWVQDP